MMLFLHILFSGVRRTVVLYDGHCRFCIRAMRLGRRLDWLRRISWLDFHDPQIRRRMRFATFREISTVTFVLTKSGKILRGFSAVRQVLLLFPLTFLCGLLAFLPPFSWLGQRLYDLISANRFGIFKCDDKCKMSQRQHSSSPQRYWEKTLMKANRNFSSSAKRPSSSG